MRPAYVVLAQPTGENAVSDEYDVIVIGTGAGGGTLAHTIAQTGKRILLLERGDFLTKELGTGIQTPSSSTGSTSHPIPGTTRTARRSSRRCTTSSAAPPRCTGRPCTGYARKTSASQARRRHLPGLAGQLHRLRAVVHQGGVALPGTRQPRRGSHRGSLVAAVSVAGGVARAASPGHFRCSRPGRLPPVPCTLRDPA